MITMSCLAEFSPTTMTIALHLSEKCSFLKKKNLLLFAIHFLIFLNFPGLFLILNPAEQQYLNSFWNFGILITPLEK